MGYCKITTLLYTDYLKDFTVDFSCHGFLSGNFLKGKDEKRFVLRDRQVKSVN